MQYKATSARVHSWFAQTISVSFVSLVYNIPIADVQYRGPVDARGKVQKQAAL